MGAKKKRSALFFHAYLFVVPTTLIIISVVGVLNSVMRPC